MHPVAWGEGDVKVEVDVRDDAEIMEAGALHMTGLMNCS